jgi:hypothetical protein
VHPCVQPYFQPPVSVLGVILAYDKGQSVIIIIIIIIMIKDKVHPRTGHEGPEGE